MVILANLYPMPIKPPTFMLKKHNYVYAFYIISLLVTQQLRAFASMVLT